MHIRDLMTPNPVTVQPDTPVDAIARILLDRRINGVPVVDGQNHLLGVVTAEDLIYRAADERLDPRESLWKENFWISFFSPEEAKPGKAGGHTASEVMSSGVRTIAPDASPSEAARLMVDYHVKSLPVIEAGTVIGMIARIDLLKHLQHFENPLKKED
jgi:CBS domain-containing protein